MMDEWWMNVESMMDERCMDGSYCVPSGLSDSKICTFKVVEEDRMTNDHANVYKAFFKVAVKMDKKNSW
jgi:hypothetical protein